MKTKNYTLLILDENVCSKMIKIKSRGEGKAELIRNKRRGLKLKVRINPSHTGSYCEYCSLNFEGCLYLCKDFERVTGTRKFWFERDEDYID